MTTFMSPVVLFTVIFELIIFYSLRSSSIFVISVPSFHFGGPFLADLAFRIAHLSLLKG
jgi:hypothetical protein